MSESAKTVLRGWSSFDDPVTMLLTVYLLAFRSPRGVPVPGSAGAHPSALLVGLAENLLFACAVRAVLWAAARVRRRADDRMWNSPVVKGIRRFALIVFLLVIGYLAIAYFLLFGLAIIGLFWRPAVRSLNRVARGALALAAVALGVVFADGVRWVAGLVLGVSAYLAQILVAPVVALGERPTDRIFLALSQQNGITAITLALILEPFYPDAVAIIGPAILVVNLLHAMTNATWNGILDRRRRPEVTLTRTTTAVPPFERAG